MATTRIKDLSKTATTVSSDANIVIDGSSNGTQKIARDNFRQDTADAYVAAPSTYKLTPLNGVNKIDATYLPTSGDTPKGEWNASTNSPTLADGTGTAGDYYDVTTAGTANLGSGAITYTVGDVVKYNGATWFKIDSVANILDGISTVDPAKSLLQIPNVGTAANEVSTNGMLGDLAFQSSAGVVVDDLTVDGLLTAAVGKPMPVNGPTMRFDGSNDYVEFADNDAFSFTNGTDDTPLSVSAWVKMEDVTNFCPISKFATVNKEWGVYFDNSDKLNVFCYTDGSNYIRKISDSALTSYTGEWTHIAFTYGGSGPNSGVAFASGYQEIIVYINGQVVSTTGSTAGTYTGMSNTSQPVYVGRANTSFSKGQIRDVKLFNKELSAAEVREVYSNGQLPESFAESTGTAALNTGTFANSATSSRQFGAITSASATGFTAAYNNANTNNRIAAPLSSAAITGKKYKATFTVNTAGADVILRFFNAATLENTGSEVATINTTTATVVNYEWTESGSAGDHIGFIDNSPAASGSLVVSDFRVTQIGSVLDARAENYNQSAGKLLDVSGNDFVGTQSGGVELLTPRSHLSAGTLDLTNLPTSATGLSAGEVYNDSGTLKIV